MLSFYSTDMTLVVTYGPIQKNDEDPFAPLRLVCGRPDKSLGQLIRVYCLHCVFLKR